MGWPSTSGTASASGIDSIAEAAGHLPEASHEAVAPGLKNSRLWREPEGRHNDLGAVRPRLPWRPPIRITIHQSTPRRRQPDRQILVLSPFRLGEQPNVHAGVAMITSAPEALALHERMARDMWRRAVKGAEAAALMRGLMAKISV